MKYTQGKYLIIDRKAIARGMFDFTIYCPEVAKISKPGQFVHALVEGYTLRRPISIASIDKEQGTLRIVFEVRGKGTSVLSNKVSDQFIDMIAPLGGTGFKLLDNNKKAMCIGGGIGTPPMLALCEYYKQNSTMISGFRDSSAVILQSDFANTGANTILCTDDGSMGKKGFVTDVIKECIDKEKPDIVYACGPKPMLKAIVNITHEYGIETQVSLEERMGCGVGACLVCACETVDSDGNKNMAHVCKDGPVFDSKEVVW